MKSENVFLGLSAVAVGVAGFFGLRKNVKVTSTPIYTYVYVDGILQGSTDLNGLDLHLSGQHTITFPAVSGWVSPIPKIEDFNILKTYHILGTYTPITVVGNLIENPDFDSALTGWETEGPIDVTIEDSGTSEGPYAQLFVGSGDYGILKQTVDAAASQRYILGAFYTGATKAPDIYVTLLDASGNVTGEQQFAQLDTIPTPAFQLAEKEFVTTSDTAAIKVSIVLNNSTGQSPVLAGVDKIILGVI
jgi:hypothetical protein